MESSPFQFLLDHFVGWGLNSQGTQGLTDMEVEILENIFQVLQQLTADAFRYFGKVVRNMKNAAEDMEASREPASASQLKHLLMRYTRTGPRKG